MNQIGTNPQMGKVHFQAWKDLILNISLLLSLILESFSDLCMAPECLVYWHQ